MDFSVSSSASPTIEVEVFGWNEEVRQTITAVLDTGFTGFLLLPLEDALIVGLVLNSMSDITLADGSLQRKLMCVGGVRFNGQSEPGLILVEDQGTEALVGMEFLKTFNLLLTLDAAAGTLSLHAKE